MKVLYRYVNTTLFMLIACLAMTLLQKGQMVKADFIDECPSQIDRTTSTCPGGEISLATAPIRCASMVNTHSTSGGDVTDYYCCKYYVDNVYCTSGGVTTPIGQVYTLFDRIGPYSKCAGEDTGQCEAVILA